jgi:hypothetical protein
MPDPTLTTGLPGLDRVIKGILPGDNIVWQVDTFEDYRELVLPFARAAHRNGKKLIYFRFGHEDRLLGPNEGAEVNELDPKRGFENFIAATHAVVQSAGEGAYYVFDVLSRMARDWYSDQMLANFFMLTCPYLYDMATVAYFGLYRNQHAARALDPIRQTTQLFLDVYRHKGDLYVHPLKVQHRHSPTMNMLHVRRGDEFCVVSSSAVIAEIMASDRWSGLSPDAGMGFWESCFMRARELVRAPDYRAQPAAHDRDLFETLTSMMLTRDPAMRSLVARYLTLEDLLEVRQRMIGTGLVGGKTVGMLLARAILKRTERSLAAVLEEHDSFYVGSDVFYEFVVRNGIWWLRQKQRVPETFLDGAEQARRRMLVGEFPPQALRQFEAMLDYFGQSPFIVRSSSLLEDNYGNSFAGKYESVFCANQGPREQRFQDLLAAIRTIYASTMSERALNYRARRGLLDKDEQMALLIMRVSGQMYGRAYYPHVAGVGFSFNPYAWDRAIDPKAGVVRLVFGLGTRAVERSDDDYTRLVALNAPEKRPETTFDQIARYAQHRVDYLDLEANQLTSGAFADLVRDNHEMPTELFASADPGLSPTRQPNWVLTFDLLLKETDLVADLRAILQRLQTAYEHPVDIEFTANFVQDHQYKINLLQCRPLQVQGTELPSVPQPTVRPEDLIISARGAVVGRSRVGQIDRLVYVVPELYGRLAPQDRYGVARLLGEINRASAKDGLAVMMIGPGRWGTRSPELGIPVVFSEINRVSVLCEIVAMHESLIPDVSLGTHFLNELVEMDMLYVALFPQQGDNYINHHFLENAPNRLADWGRSAERWTPIVRVVDASTAPAPVLLWADAMEQRVVCCLHRDA